MLFSIILGSLCLLAISTAQEVGKCPKIVKRAQWGARAPKHTSPLDGKPNTVLIKSEGLNCVSRNRCQESVRNLQSSDMLIDSFDDIKCNFVIGSDGLVYEGRGWKNSVDGNKALALCVLGIYSVKSPGPLQIKTLKNFLSCQATKSMLDPSYKITTLRDIFPVSTNPHINLYKIVQKLPHYIAPATIAPVTAASVTASQSPAN